jgi:hypothetical protein
MTSAVQPCSPPPVPAGSAAAFAGALHATGYMIPLLKGVELIGALLLLRRRFVPLALVMLAPVVVNIAAFHLFLAPGGLAIAAFLVAAMIYLAAVHAPAFRALLGTRQGARETSPDQQRILDYGSAAGQR